MFDFCKRLIYERAINVLLKVLFVRVHLIVFRNRAQKFEELPKIIDRALEKKKAERTGQIGLFEMSLPLTTQLSEDLYVFQHLADWPDA